MKTNHSEDGFDGTLPSLRILATVAGSLDIRDLAIYKRDLEVLVDVNQLGAQFDNLLRLAENGFHLLRGLS